MGNIYNYFKNGEIFIVEDDWGTSLPFDKELNMLSIRLENLDCLKAIYERIQLYACKFWKAEVLCSFVHSENDAIAISSHKFCSDLYTAFYLSKINLQEIQDGDVIVIKAVTILLKAGEKYFKLIIDYSTYEQLGKNLILFKTSELPSFEAIYNFPISSINENGDVRLTEGLVKNCGSFKVYLKMGDEHIHNRPHVQCKMNGKLYNISIDGEIEFLGDKSKRDKNAAFLEKRIQKDSELLQSARKLWNLVPSSYKFLINKKGELVPR